MKEKKKRAKRLPTFAESITPIIAMLRGIYRVPCGCYLG